MPRRRDTGRLHRRDCDRRRSHALADRLCTCGGFAGRARFRQAHRIHRGHDRQVAEHPYRHQFRRHRGWRPGDRRRGAADRSFALGPRQENRHDPGLGLCRRQEAGRRVRHRSLLRRSPARGGAQATLPPGAFPRLLRQRTDHAVGHLCGRPDTRQGGDHCAPVRPGRHQFGAGSAVPAGPARGSLRRDSAPCCARSASSGTW